MKKKLIVACDLFWNLKLYHVPATCLQSLGQTFPFVEIQEINTGSAQAVALDAIEVYWGNRITPEFISSLPALKWIHFGSIGTNRAALREVIERKIIVTNSAGTMETAVAVSAFGFMIILGRGFHHCARLQASHDLSRGTFDQFFENIHDLEAQECLIVGLGEVGKKVARLAESIGMRICAIKNDTTCLPKNISGIYKLPELRQAVKSADYVVNLLPFTKQTHQVFNAEIFGAMKESAFFINVGRGETVNEADLIEALIKRRIAGAGLDVFAQEPLDKSSRLWTLPNVVLTPHIAGLSNKYWGRECALFQENLRRYLASEALLNIVDLTKGY